MPGGTDLLAPGPFLVAVLEELEREAAKKRSRDST